MKQTALTLTQRPITAWITVMALLVLLGWLVVSSIQQLWLGAKVKFPVQTAAPVIQGPAASIIPQLHLFGNSATDLKDLPLASLGLQVQGIFLNADPKQSRVLISMTGQASQLYNVGDVLPGNVRIYKIMRDSVIVSHDNQLEKLPFALQGIDFNNINTERGLFE